MGTLSARKPERRIFSTAADAQTSVAKVTESDHAQAHFPRARVRQSQEMIEWQSFALPSNDGSEHPS